MSDDVLGKYGKLRSQLESPLQTTVTVPVALAIREIYDYAFALQAQAQGVARTALRRLMADLSEEYFSAGWKSGLEFDLWAACQETGEQPWLQVDVAELRSLRDLAGGWWLWSEDAGDVVFVSLAKMEEEIAAWNR